MSNSDVVAANVLIFDGMRDDWFNKYHVKDVTQEFIDWWIGYYGVPGDYERKGQHEYYIRMAFSLAGWRAKEKHYVTEKKL